MCATYRMVYLNNWEFFFFWIVTVVAVFTNLLVVGRVTIVTPEVVENSGCGLKWKPCSVVGESLLVSGLNQWVFIAIARYQKLLGVLKRANYFETEEKVEDL